MSLLISTPWFALNMAADNAGWGPSRVLNEGPASTCIALKGTGRSRPDLTASSLPDGPWISSHLLV